MVTNNELTGSANDAVTLWGDGHVFRSNYIHDHFIVQRALRGLRIGLITNHTGIDRLGNPTIDLLRSAEPVDRHCDRIDGQRGRS